MATTGIAERHSFGPVASQPTVVLIARICLGAIFLMSGAAKLFDTAGTVQHMVAAGIPAAGTLVYVAAIAEICGALAIMTGFLTRLGAAGLVVFLAITTVAFHHFWTLGGDEQKAQMINFMKNLAIIGGLGMLVATGAGRCSIDAKRRKPLA